MINHFWFSRHPLQEYLNAGTIVLPNLVSVWYTLYNTDADTGATIPLPKVRAGVTPGSPSCWNIF